MVDDLFQSVFCITDHALSYNSIILMSMIFSLCYFCLHIDLEANFPARVLYPPHPQSRNEKKKRAKITFVLSWKYRCLPAHWYGCTKTIQRSLIGERGSEKHTLLANLYARALLSVFSFCSPVEVAANARPIAPPGSTRKTKGTC